MNEIIRGILSGLMAVIGWEIGRHIDKKMRYITLYDPKKDAKATTLRKNKEVIEILKKDGWTTKKPKK